MCSHDSRQQQELLSVGSSNQCMVNYICTTNTQVRETIGGRSQLKTFNTSQFYSTEHKKVAGQTCLHFTSIVSISKAHCSTVLQNNSICYKKREFNDRQTRKIGHNILSCSLTVFSFHHSLSLRLKHTSGEPGWEALAQPQSTGPSPNKETINHV